MMAWNVPLCTGEFQLLLNLTEVALIFYAGTIVNFCLLLWLKHHVTCTNTNDPYPLVE